MKEMNTLTIKLVCAILTKNKRLAIWIRIVKRSKITAVLTFPAASNAS